MLAYFRLPFGWMELFRRTFASIGKDDVTSMASQLAYAFFFSLFPALIFLVALVSFFPLEGVIDQLTARAGEVVPPDMMKLITDQLKQISDSNQSGLLTFGILLTIFSASSGMAAVINTVNRAYDITESRPWWKVRLIAIGLTIAMAIFALLSLGLVMVGPQLAGRLADQFGLGGAFELAWNIAQWPVVFLLIATGVGLVYYFAPDAEQDWVWITPGSLAATLLWVLASLGFRFYVTNFASYNATYGAIGGIMVALTWLYLSAVMLLVGAEMNAEIEHASPYGKEPGEKQPGVRRKLGTAAARAWEQARTLGHRTPSPAPAAAFAASSGADRERLVAGEAQAAKSADRAAREAVAAHPARRVGRSRLVLGGLILGEVALEMWRRVRRTRTRA